VLEQCVKVLVREVRSPELLQELETLLGLGG